MHKNLVLTTSSATGMGKQCFYPLNYDVDNGGVIKKYFKLNSHSLSLKKLERK